MQEIGSEFWDVPIKSNKSNFIPKAAQWYLSGRSALKAIIQELQNCHTVAMPSWCCESIVEPFLQAGYMVRYYPVYWEYKLHQELRFDCDVLLLMDYFGYTSPQVDLSDYHGVIIRDTTHSVFSTTYTDADYYFGSLRKWCGLWSGGYAFTRDSHSLQYNEGDDFGYISLRKRAMELKKNYMNNDNLNYRNTGDNKEYLNVFEQAERCLETIGALPAAERDISLASKMDVEYIKKARRENAEVLRLALPEWLIFSKMDDSDCPMFVPIIVPNGRRDELRSYLISNKIYCPIHWPVSQLHDLTEKEKYLYNNELSLVCDQRYNADDMRRIVSVIQDYSGV